ncbi:hypothetical protein GF325_02795 [Candidatus Bathyarchaeota archaeon]|nr:hypothetical protein [Candidatus Bathyarchaeota archaeon]
MLASLAHGTCPVQGSGGILEDIKNENVVGLASCGKDELSHESTSLEQGVFTHNLLDGFEHVSGIEKADAGGDGFVSWPTELFDHVNATSHAYYDPLNLTVTPQCLHAPLDANFSLDWHLDTTGVQYQQSSMTLDLWFETNRTDPFTLDVPCQPVLHGYIDDLSPPGFPLLVQLPVQGNEFPAVVNLSGYLEPQDNYHLSINQIIQGHVFSYEYDPFTVDTDGDGIVDGIEWDLPAIYDVMDGTDGVVDHDHDGLDAAKEIYLHGTPRPRSNRLVRVVTTRGRSVNLYMQAI